MVEIGAPTPIGPFFEDLTLRRNYYTFYVRGFQAIPSGLDSNVAREFQRLLLVGKLGVSKTLKLAKLVWAQAKIEVSSPL